MIAPPSIQLVFDLEAGDAPLLLGEYDGTVEDVVFYRHSTGQRSAPADCVEVATFHAQPFGGRAKLVAELTPSDDRLARLRDETTPAPGRDGVRVDGNGREWYSASWLGLVNLGYQTEGGQQCLTFT